MLASSIDWALRGGAVALLLLLAIVLWRDHRGLLSARLGAAFAIGSGAYAITSTAGFSPALGIWTFPLIALSSGNNVVFWAFASALFDDSFRLRGWHAALWLLLVMGGFAMCLVPGQALGLALTLSSLAFAVLAIATTIASWRTDLVERRRRVRLFVVGASALYIGLNAAAQMAGVPRSAPAEGSLVGGLGLLAIVGLSAVMGARAAGADAILLIVAALSSDSFPADVRVRCGDLLIDVAGVHLELLADRAVWLAATRTLLIADLHLGKAQSFRRAGVPVPSGTTAASGASPPSQVQRGPSGKRASNSLAPSVSDRRTTP